MKTKSILVFFLAVLCVIAGCRRMENSKTSNNAVDTVDATKMTAILTDDDCFEKRMERWFATFNQLQDEGLNMEKAHHQAIASVALEFKDCNGVPNAIPDRAE